MDTMESGMMYEYFHANDNGAIDIGDPIGLLSYLFTDGPDSPLPFPNPGIDPTEDELSC